MSVITRIVYTADGLTNIYAIPFDYLSRSHVFIKVNGQEKDDVNWLSAYSIQTNGVPIKGSVIEIARHTPYDSQFITWSDGTVLFANDLNAQALQTLFVLQENMDALINLNQRLTDFDTLISSIDTKATEAAAVLEIKKQAALNELRSIFGESESLLSTLLQQAENYATASCACASASQAFYQQTALLTQKFANIYMLINTVDGGDSLSTLTVLDILDGEDSSTMSGITGVYDGKNSFPSSWYRIDPVVLDALTPKGITDITFNEYGEMVITVNDPIETI